MIRLEIKNLEEELCNNCYDLCAADYDPADERCEAHSVWRKADDIRLRAQDEIEGLVDKWHGE